MGTVIDMRDVARHKGHRAVTGCTCPHCICSKDVRRFDYRSICHSCEQGLHLKTPRSPWELYDMASEGLIECVESDIDCGCIYDPCGCPCHE